MVPTNVPKLASKHRFPRASGDGPREVAEAKATQPFPPRERGWSRKQVFCTPTKQVSPARAGMVPRI